MEVDREFIFGCTTFPLQPFFRLGDPVFEYAEVGLTRLSVLHPRSQTYLLTTATFFTATGAVAALYHFVPVPATIGDDACAISIYSVCKTSH